MKEHVPYPEIPFLIAVESENINENRQQLNEFLKMTTVGKLFFTGVAAWLLGRASRLKIKGTPEEVRAIADAMMASRVFQDELRRNNGNVDAVMEKLKLKHARGADFTAKLGVPWIF